MGQFSFLSLGLLVVFLSLRGAEGYRCPADWFCTKGLCYKAFSEQKTWFDAEMFCRKLKPGCHLASIHSNADSSILAWYIYDYFTSHGNVWIGLQDTRKGGPFLLKRTWEWTDSSVTDHFAWNQGEPNNKENKEFCVHIWSSTGYLKWNDTPCESLNNFLCQCKF